MDPGSYIAVAELAFRTAAFTVRAFRNGLNFTKDAEQLVLRFELQRVRLQLWGENSGIVPLPGSGDRPKLPARLEPLSELLKRQLEDIAAIFCQHSALSDRYGLAKTDQAPTKSDIINDLVLRIQKSFPSQRSKLAENGNGDSEEDQEVAINLQRLGSNTTNKHTPRPSQITISAWKKIRWSILDLKKFDTLVSDLSTSVSALNQLLTEVSQQRKIQENDSRINIVFVGSAFNPESLNLLRAAVSGFSETSPARLGVERKALSTDTPWLSSLSAPPLISSKRETLELADFHLPLARTPGELPLRFLATRKVSDGTGDGLFLFEKKAYDDFLDAREKRRLTERIKRLVLLLKKPKSPKFLTPEAVGCINDTKHHCWWFVFRYPSPLLHSPANKQDDLAYSPVSLAALLNRRHKFRPALEQRYILASRIANTLSELYSSSWLHKGIRSDNITFPALFSPRIGQQELTPVGGIGVALSPLFCGFEYSRQESDISQQSDNTAMEQAMTPHEVSMAIYRHPNYLGEAANGYCLEYDLYSLGMVLLEIALWKPLSDLLEVGPAGGDGGGSGRRNTEGDVFPALKLSKDMHVFNRKHARVLRKLVRRLVASELAFRVGSAYHRAVLYCLEAADTGDSKGSDEEDLMTHPALDFYNNVAVPLARLAAAVDEGVCYLK